MIELLALSWSFVQQRTVIELVGFLWFLLVFDIPRYFLGFISVFITRRLTSGRAQATHWPGSASVLIAAHNEEASIERCVRSLRAQQGRRLEIICVDDGSTDATHRIMQQLSEQGLVDRVLRVTDRGGKSAALNLAATMARGDALVVVDCDCVFEEHAVERLLAPLNDPRVGAVAGSVLVRNAQSSVLASIQAVEYLFSVHLGRTLLDYFDLIVCVSGAIGAFRREAWQMLGGMDVGPGEDFDITLRLRQAGYRIRFAGDAVAWTAVPERLDAFIGQRRRWERDAVRIRLRKFSFTLNPFDRRFRLAEALHQIEFMVYSVLSGILFLAYVVWLATEVPELLPVLLLITTLAIIVLDAITLLVAAFSLRRPAYLWLLPFVPLFAPFQFLIMRNARLLAYAEELVFSTSHHDNFVPAKVRRWHI